MIDFIHGIIGTFIEKIEEKEGFVRVIYVPLNGVRAVEFPEALPEDVVSNVIFPNKNFKGITKEGYVIIKENASGKAPFLESAGTSFGDTIERYREQISNDDLTIRRERQRAKQATAEIAKQRATEHELKKKTGDDDSNSDFSSRMNNLRNRGGRKW